MILYRVAWQSKFDGREGAGFWSRDRELIEHILAEHNEFDPNFDYFLEQTDQAVDPASIMIDDRP